MALDFWGVPQTQIGIYFVPFSLGARFLTDSWSGGHQVIVTGEHLKICTVGFVHLFLDFLQILKEHETSKPKSPTQLGSVVRAFNPRYGVD